jgi:hypothetical protein
MDGTRLAREWGGVHPRRDLEKARAVRTTKADARAAQLATHIADARQLGCTSLRRIAEKFDCWRIPAPRGGSWSAEQIRQLVTRLDGR